MIACGRFYSRFIIRTRKPGMTNKRARRVAACEGVEFVTDTITIACSADRTCEVAKAMEITFAFGSLFLERELSKM